MKAIVNGFNQEYDNNNNRKLIFESTTLHNFNKGCGRSYLNLSFIVTQQIIKCLICIKKGKIPIISFASFFSNLHIKH
jgi:hypothetical protein